MPSHSNARTSLYHESTPPHVVIKAINSYLIVWYYSTALPLSPVCMRCMTLYMYLAICIVCLSVCFDWKYLNRAIECWYGNGFSHLTQAHTALTIDTAVSLNYLSTQYDTNCWLSSFLKALSKYDTNDWLLKELGTYDTNHWLSGFLKALWGICCFSL